MAARQRSDSDTRIVVKSLMSLLLIIALSFLVSAIDVAIIGVKPHTSEQWVDAEKISGTLHKTLTSAGFKVLSSNEVSGLVGDRKAYLERYTGGVPTVSKVDAVVIGSIVPQGNNYVTSLQFFNLASGQSVSYSQVGNPLTNDKNVANGLLGRINTSLSQEHKVSIVGSTTVEILTTGLGAFKGQVFNVYRQEAPANAAFAKYMKSPLVKVGEIEVVLVNGNRATAKILKEDAYLKIKSGDFVSRQVVLGFGSLEIDSIPRGANVYLDGYFIGRTPLNLRNVPEGTYNLVFQEPLHSDMTERVKVNSNATTRVMPTLKEKPGQLQITSNKQGDLYINNVRQGKTPLTVELPRGLYRIEVLVPGYPKHEQSVWVTPGLSSMVFFHISGSPAESYFDSNPQGASLYIDGKYYGEAPFGPIFLEPGYHDILMKKPGWKDWSEKVLFNSGNKERVNAIMELPPGILTVYSEPTRATVIVDGKEIGKTPLTYTDAGPGTLKVEIVKEGYRTVVNTINIYSNERLTISEKLELKVGTLSIKTKQNNVGAKVYLNGSYRGKTPLVLEELPEGRYTLELHYGNMASRDQITISDREKKEFVAELVPYWQLENIEKRVVGSVGTDFLASPLILGVNGSLVVSKDFTLKAGFDHYSGDFGGGYGEYAKYSCLYLGGDYYLSQGVGLFGLFRYRTQATGDTFTEAGGGLAFRLLDPERYVLNARLGAVYDKNPKLFWEIESYGRVLFPNLVIGAKLGSSPMTNIEGRLSLGITF